jgi:proline iminopeptidase
MLREFLRREVFSVVKRLMVAALFLCGAVGLPAQLVAVVHETGVIQTPEVAIGYETFGARGSALPVIAVNGGPGLSHAYMMMNDLWKQVAADRLVILYDQRGTGASKKLASGAPQTMDAQVADLEAVRAHFGIDKVALVGDSYGGFLVMAYAAEHPEHVAKLVLSDSPPPSFKTMVHLLPQTFPDIEEEDEAATKKLGNTDAAAQLELRNHFRMIFYSPEKRDAYLAKMGDLTPQRGSSPGTPGLGFEPAVAGAVSQSAGALDLTQAVEGFHFPVLVITGRYDMNVAPINAWKMAHEIPGAKIVFFEESGHLPAYEEPEKYRRVLAEFLSRQ